MRPRNLSYSPRLKHILATALFVAFSARLAGAQTAAVTGQVRAADGTPAAGVRVALASINETGGVTADVLAGITTTDNKGRYRIENIEAGRYGLVAGPVGSPTYFPGVPTAAEAKVLSIESRATIAGLDFTLTPGFAEARVVQATQGDTLADVFENAQTTNLPDNEADLLVYLTMLADQKGRTQTSPSTFEIALTSVHGREISFLSLKEGAFWSFRSTCTDCTFLAGDSGIADPSSSSEAGIILKLNAKGDSLALTCRASECLIVSPAGQQATSRLPNSEARASAGSTLPVVREIPAVGPVYFRVTE
jgi:Carboxypeptidase regulatory-like domain